MVNTQHRRRRDGEEMDAEAELDPRPLRRDRSRFEIDIRHLVCVPHLSSRVPFVDRERHVLFFPFWGGVSSRMFGSDRILTLWPSLLRSPVLSQFAWSPLVEMALERNMHLLHPINHTRIPPNFPLLSPNDQYSPIPGLLTLHIRRGDFAQHCDHLAYYSSTWNGFNTFPSFPDQFTPPPRNPPSPPSSSQRKNIEVYRKHCYPTIDQIVDKVLDVKATAVGRNLKNVYILTNGVADWTEQLKEALGRAAKWDRIVSSKDIELNKEQKYIAPAIDMMIGQKGQVFVGNGVRRCSDVGLFCFRTLTRWRSSQR
jgi:hypothetical protein